MDEGWKTNIFETQSWDAAGQFVRYIFPSFSRFSDPRNPNRQLENQQYISALALIDTLLTELKRLDDKMILTEVHLLESRVYRGIGNFAKAKVWRPMHFRCIRLRLHYTLGCSYIFKNGSEFDLLSAYASSLPWSPIRHSPRGRQGLHHCLLVLLRSLWKPFLPRWRRGARGVEIYASM